MLRPSIITIHAQTASGRIRPRNKLFVDYIEKKGYHVDFEHALIELIKENGAVTGAIVQNSAGEYIKITTSKGVILATGGYEGNPDMMEALSPLGGILHNRKQLFRDESWRWNQSGLVGRCGYGQGIRSDVI